MEIRCVFIPTRILLTVVWFAVFVAAQNDVTTSSVATTPSPAPAADSTNDVSVSLLSVTVSTDLGSSLQLCANNGTRCSDGTCEPCDNAVSGTTISTAHLSTGAHTTPPPPPPPGTGNDPSTVTATPSGTDSGPNVPIATAGSASSQPDVDGFSAGGPSSDPGQSSAADGDPGSGLPAAGSAPGQPGDTASVGTPPPASSPSDSSTPTSVTRSDTYAGVVPFSSDWGSPSAFPIGETTPSSPSVEGSSTDMPTVLTTKYIDPMAFHTDVQYTTRTTMRTTAPDAGGSGEASGDPGSGRQGGWGHVWDSGDGVAPPGGVVSAPDNTATAEGASQPAHDTLLAPTAPAEVTPSTRDNVTDNRLLPDDSKAKKDMSPVPMASDPDLAPPDVSFPGGFGPQPPLAIDPLPVVTESGPTSGPDFEPGPAGGEPGGVPGSPWWPSNDQRDEGKPADSKQDFLDELQIVFFVAPCFGALLAVIGVACVIRYATARWRERRRLINKLKKQRKEEEEKQKQQQQKESAKTQVKEENETNEQQQRRQKKHKKHHRHHRHHKDTHHHHLNNGYVSYTDLEEKGAKSSRK